jgi:hypothetical protein
MGGMSQHHETTVPVMSRTGCTCHKVMLPHPVTIRPRHVVYHFIATDTKTGDGLYQFRNQRMGGTKYYVRTKIGGHMRYIGIGRPKANGVWRKENH